VVTSFSKQQALSITSHLYHTLLPHLGVHHNYPLALQHTPIKYQGLGLPHPYWEQGIAAVCLFLELSNTNRPESVLLQTSLEYLQLEIGVSIPILQADFARWGHLATPCWLKSLWNFLHNSHISLHTSHSYIPPLQRQGDAFLMECFAMLSLSTTDLAALNHCRLAHHILFLLDVSNGWGHSLHAPILSAPSTPPKSIWSWPCSAPVASNWITWDRCLRQLLPTMILGQWLTPPHLSSFCPYKPETSTAFLPGPSHSWHFFWLRLHCPP